MMSAAKPRGHSTHKAAAAPKKQKRVIVEQAKPRQRSREQEAFRKAQDAKNDDSSRPVSPSVSAKTEITDDLLPHCEDGDAFGCLLVACTNFAGGRCVFTESDDRIRNAMVPAYEVYCEIKSDDVLHQRLIAHVKATRRRRRKGSLRKPALNAVVLACHPENVAAYKRCSDWANLLAWADLDEVKPEDFAVWVAGRGIADAKFKIRQMKAGDEPRDRSGRRIVVPLLRREFPSVVHALDEKDARILDRMREAFVTMEAVLNLPSDVQKPRSPTPDTATPFFLADRP